jgi:hypothetical protein
VAQRAARPGYVFDLRLNQDESIRRSTFRHGARISFYDSLTPAGRRNGSNFGRQVDAIIRALHPAERKLLR